MTRPRPCGSPRDATAPGWRAALASLMIALLIGAVACKTADDTDGDSDAQSSRPKRTDQQERIVQLIKQYEASPREGWPEARRELLAMGPDGERALFRYLMLREFNKRKPSEVDRAIDEYVEAMKASGGSPAGVDLLIDACSGHRAGRTFYMTSANRVAQGLRGTSVRLPDGPLPIAEALALVCKETGEAVATAETRERELLLALARVNMVALAGSAGATAAQLDLDDIEKQIALIDEEQRWKVRSRFIESLGYVDGPQAQLKLEAALRDDEEIVRDVAAEALRRRKRRTKAGGGR